jgi:hypothetical protein
LPIVDANRVGLFYQDELLDTVSFPAAFGFYRQKTSGGLPFIGNAVIQGMDWVAFQCLWPCEFAIAGKPCEYCFSGADFEARAKKDKPQPAPVAARDVAEVVAYAVSEVGVSHLQITGGSTFDGVSEFTYVREYLEALLAAPASPLAATSASPLATPSPAAAASFVAPSAAAASAAAAASSPTSPPAAPFAGAAALTCALPGEKLLYLTPPADLSILDEYFALGASRVACSLEVWDEQVAGVVTAGKMDFTGRERHLAALEYVAQRYGPARAFSNFIIGIESFETLAAGARHLAERGIMPSASVWMPMGRPVRGSMKPPNVEYYQRMKELFAQLYTSYDLEPVNSRGLNVCVERDIWNYAHASHT